MKEFRSVRFVWAPIAVAVTGLAGLVYLTVQQDMRMTANDPQIQLATDAAAALARGADVQAVVPKQTVDIATSLAPYLVVYSADGKPVAGSGMLDGALPTVPSGVFGFTAIHGEDRITWQPRSGVRSAIVVVRVQGDHPGFVLAGRSLREVERREDQLSLHVVAAWVVTLAAVLATTVFLR